LLAPLTRQADIRQQIDAWRSGASTIPTYDARIDAPRARVPAPDIYQIGLTTPHDVARMVFEDDGESGAGR
jgi:hypothetical protein